MGEAVITQEKRCYTIKELQEILGISRPTVYELLKKNEFRWIQIGTKYRISKKSFDEWLDQKCENVILSTEGGTAEMDSADENRAGNTADNVGARNEKTDWNK